MLAVRWCFFFGSTLKPGISTLGMLGMGGTVDELAGTEGVNSAAGSSA